MEQYKLPPDPTYSYIDENTIEEELKCMHVCFGPLDKPIVHSECEISFCNDCIVKLNYKCPICRIGNIHQYKPLTTKLVMNLLNKINIKCDICDKHMNRGDFKDHIPLCPFNCFRECETQINRKNAKEHDNICENMIIKCGRDCGQLFMRKHLNKHDEECPEKLIKCSISCEILIFRKEINRHDSVCSEKVIKCPNGCNGNIKRKNIIKHNSICPDVEICCSGNDVGCNVKILRKDFDAHIKSCIWVQFKPIIQHFNNENNSLKQEIIKLNKIIELQANEISKLNQLTNKQNIFKKNFIVSDEVDNIIKVLQDNPDVKYITWLIGNYGPPSARYPKAATLDISFRMILQQGINIAQDSKSIILKLTNTNLLSESKHNALKHCQLFLVSIFDNYNIKIVGDDILVLELYYSNEDKVYYSNTEKVIALINALSNT